MFYLFFLPRDMSSSSTRFNPTFWVRACGKEKFELGGSVLAETLSPSRSRRAELLPDFESAERWMELNGAQIHVEQRFALQEETGNEHLVVRIQRSPLSSPPRPSPAACTGWWPASGCRWPAGCPLPGGNWSATPQLSNLKSQIQTYLKLHRCLRCRSLTWTESVSSFHSAGKDPEIKIMVQ